MVRISEVTSYWMEEGAPLIAISGLWLKDFGFDIGKRIVVDIAKGQIVIKLIDTEEF